MLRAMFGARTSQVFTSRWKALLWSAGVMTTAYCTIPSADDSSTAVTANAKPGQPSEQELQAREIIRNLDSLRNTPSSGD